MDSVIDSVINVVWLRVHETKKQASYIGRIPRYLGVGG